MTWHEGLTRLPAGTQPSPPGVPSKGLTRGHRRRAPPREWCPAQNACRCSAPRHEHLHAQNKVEPSTDLERKVFQGVRDTGLGLVPAAGLDEEGDSGGGLAVVRGGDLHAGGVDDGREPARITGYARRAARGCKHWERDVREVEEVEENDDEQSVQLDASASAQPGLSRARPMGAFPFPSRALASARSSPACGIAWA